MLALSDVVRGVGGTGDVVVVHRSLLALLGVDAVLADVPDGQVGGAKPIGVDPVKRVDDEVVRRQVEDRDAVGVDRDPVPPDVAAVEDDARAVDAADRQIVLGRRNDDAAEIRPAVDEDRVARIGPRDRLRDRRLVLRDADRRPRGISARETETGNQSTCESRD